MRELGVFSRSHEGDFGQLRTLKLVALRDFHLYTIRLQNFERGLHGQVT